MQVRYKFIRDNILYERIEQDFIDGLPKTVVERKIEIVKEQKDDSKKEEVQREEERKPKIGFFKNLFLR